MSTINIRQIENNVKAVVANCKVTVPDVMVEQQLEDYIEDLEDDDDTKDKVIVDDVDPNYNFSKINLGFVDTKASDISNVNLLTTPVEITFTCSDKKQTKTVLIDSKTKLSNGVNILLSKNTTWDYYIDSRALLSM